MNTINHVNLSTSDPNGLAHFFAQVFDFRTIAEHRTGNFKLHYKDNVVEMAPTRYMICS
jgi:predicted enzyme related to lactoylglutathione lyase